MKIGVSATMYTPPFAPILFKDRPGIAALLRDVSASGADCVDLFVNELTDEQLDEAGQALADGGLSLSLLLSFLPATLGQTLTHPDLEKRAACLAFYERQLHRTHRLGGNMQCIGLGRGNTEGRSMAEYDRVLTESLLRLQETAVKLGIWLIIEPCNRYEIDNYRTVASCMEFIDRTGLDLGLLPDLFHMNIEDPDVPAALRQAGKRIGHMHVADTHRLAPGTGHMDYPAVLKALADVGYEGALAMECPPVPDEQTCVRQGMGYLRGLLNERNLNTGRK